MKIGIISDTHGYFDPQIPSLLDGVEHILHGGDVGEGPVRPSLEKIAPLTAVLGNTDYGLDLSETEVLQLGGRKFLVHHILDVDAPDEVIEKRIERERPDVVVFGHTHKICNRHLGTTLYLNPGYSGKPRSGVSRSVAVLNCDPQRVMVEFRSLHP
jgi:putative phosphoesterase